MDFQLLRPVTLNDDYSDLASWQEGKMILLDKPLEWTSFDLVNKCKLAFRFGLKVKKIKIGHAGTLDPLATGLMLVLVGKYTKLTPEIHTLTKTYEGSLFLGATTPSYDGERAIDAHFPIDHIHPELLFDTASQFVGQIVQFPPVFSAVKIDGKKAYIAAHKGKSIITRERSVDIFQFTIDRIELPVVNFTVTCSSGTYIRTLVHDFGQALQSGAYLTRLRRTRIGPWSIADAMDVQTFASKLASTIPTEITLPQESN
ncbi:MAG: tRNA pseudouridine(55) synthase TruB [Saprospiraceae bacterium]|nr:tRNA pseudouridine(55) synthase TruB [Saprospiraceae bacterium]